MTSSILGPLNGPQKQAVENTEGPLLILAGPGSGKTRVITSRIAYLISEKGIPPSRILAVTFTNKAAREMRERLDMLIGNLSQYVNARTFHAFCASVLRRDGDKIGLDRSFTIYDRDDQVNLIKQVMEIEQLDPRRFTPNNILNAISTAKSQLIDPQMFLQQSSTYIQNVIQASYQRYQELLNRNKSVDFDDLLMLTGKLFSDDPDTLNWYQNHYTYILIDEFQDTNTSQYALTKQLSGKHKNICVVGDPDQSIYSWRNADIRNILSFQQDFPGTKLIKLEENYRSTKNILDAAYKVISTNTNRIERGLHTNNDLGTPIIIEEAYNPDEEAQMLLKEIQRLKELHNYNLNDFAFMYRVNAQSRAVEEGCLRYGIRYNLIGGLRFYQRKEVKDIIAYLRILANPNDEVSLLRIINIPTRGIGQRTIDSLVQFARSEGIPLYSAIQAIADPKLGEEIGDFTSRTSKSLRGFLDIINSLAKTSQTTPVAQIIDQVADITGYRAYLYKDKELGRERWENVQELRSTAMEFDKMAPEESLTSFLEGIGLISDIDNLTENEDAITLITLHQAKGLEFPVVFMIGMEEGLIPHIRSMENPEEVEEERRLAYVGMTRAKERLYMTRSFNRFFRGSSGPTLPSRFLSDIPVEITDRIVKPEPNRIARPTISNISKNNSQPSNNNLPELKTGDKINHSRFGEGIIVSLTASTAGDQEITIAFKGDIGIKKLLLGFAPIEKID
ncbi:MAG: UvrD-helicase domain-containing protein [Dehalococcoidia bacterium]|nr:UvrD-helicase domain-containing protein [Dehalococcoidia bacterium]